MSEIAIRVQGLEKRYRVWAHAPPTNLKERVRISAASVRARAHLGEREQFRHEVWAIRGISFDVRRGEVLGVIGPNGAGKSTLLAILSRITEPTGGRVEINGRVSSLLEVGTGFHPELSGRDNVFLNGAILGMSRAETKRKFDEIVEFSGVADFIDIPVKRYSSGMQVRLAFAVAAHLDPEVLLLDEVLAVGDAEFQAKSHARVEEIARSGRTVLFVSHDVGAVGRLCDNAIVLRNGRISFSGTAEDAVEEYLVGADAPSGDSTRWRDPTSPIEIKRVEARSRDESGKVRVGSPVEIVVELEASEPIAMREIRLELALYTAAGLQVAAFSTGLDGPDLLDFGAVSGRTALACTVDGLPFKPGAYVVGAALYRYGQLVDQINRAFDLTVLPAPFFSSGGVPTNFPAQVLLRHSWAAAQMQDIAEAAERHAGAASGRNA